jgi:hypothetical protein
VNARHFKVVWYEIPASCKCSTQVSILNQLKHPNIVSIIGCVESQGSASPCKKIAEKFGAHPPRYLPALVLGMTKLEICVVFAFVCFCCAEGYCPFFIPFFFQA